MPKVKDIAAYDDINKMGKYIDYIRKHGFFAAVYNYLYFIGCFIIRSFRLIKRRTRLYIKIQKVKFLKAVSEISVKYKKYFYAQSRKITKPVKNISSKIESLRDLKNPDAGLTKQDVRKKKLGIIKSLTKDFCRYTYRMSNYILPVIAFLVMMNVLSYYQNLDYVLKVEYNGRYIGYIKKESDFYEAEKQMRDRITQESYIKPVDAVPRFTLVTNKSESVAITSIDTLTNLIIAASGNQITDSDGLYIDGKFVGAMESADPLLDFLSDTLEENKTGAKNEQVSFVNKIEIKSGLYPVTSLVEYESVVEKLTSLQEQEKIYITEKGDAPTTIAKKVGMPYQKLKQLNPGIEEKLLIGQEVIISAAVPYLGIKRVVTETYEEDIPYKIERTVSKDYDVGYSKTTEEGENGIREITAKTVYIDGFEEEKTIISSTVVKEPVNEKITMGGKTNANYITNQNTPANSTSSSPGGYIWPLRGGRVTMRIWGYPGHTGMDIGTPIGTPVYAMAPGTVVLVKSTVWGYGKQIMIDHGGGVRTLYAHNSQLLVRVGDFVQQGQVIAYSGNSGNSSGPHLHVEFRVNGQYQDPGKYIGYYPH